MTKRECGKGDRGGGGKGGKGGKGLGDDEPPGGMVVRATVGVLCTRKLRGGVEDGL